MIEGWQCLLLVRDRVLPHKKKNRYGTESSIKATRKSLVYLWIKKKRFHNLKSELSTFNTTLLLFFGCLTEKVGNSGFGDPFTDQKGFLALLSHRCKKKKQGKRRNTRNERGTDYSCPATFLNTKIVKSTKYSTQLLNLINRSTKHLICNLRQTNSIYNFVDFRFSVRMNSTSHF